MEQISKTAILFSLTWIALFRAENYFIPADCILFL